MSDDRTAGGGVVIPADPLDVEQLPPDDINVCEHCKGHGVVVIGRDHETDIEVDIECTWCDGTGDRRVTPGPRVIRCRPISVDTRKAS